MRVHVERTSKVDRTPRVMQVESMFDVPPSEKAKLVIDADLELEDREWNVGLIVGPSGAGKSSVAHELFGDAVVSGFDWSPSRSVLDDFPDSSIKTITGYLTSVGFSSPPAWMRPFSTLSTGEQFRVTIARALAEREQQLVVVDEFTSTVDRRVAQIASSTIAKAVRRQKRQLVAVTCHYDVIEWLQPDWVYQPHEQSFVWRSLQRRPSIDVTVHPVDRSAWRLFGPHHYLSSDLASASVCFGAWVEDEIVAFCSYLHFPHPRVRNLKMGHRMVVLPDYQGLGIGVRVENVIGELLRQQGFRYRIVAAHPAMVRALAGAPEWRCVRVPRTTALERTTTTDRGLRRRNLDPRRLVTYSFEYAGRAAQRSSDEGPSARSA